MICAIGLPLTNVVKIFTGSPRYDEMLATFDSALVACIRKVPPTLTGWPAGGVMRIPMLVGTTSAYLQFFFSSIFMILPVGLKADLKRVR